MLWVRRWGGLVRACLSVCVCVCVCVSGGRDKEAMTNAVVGADFTEKVIIEGRRRRR